MLFSSALVISPKTYIVLALATNRPGDLDSAVADRVDRFSKFPYLENMSAVQAFKPLSRKVYSTGWSEKAGLFQRLFRKEHQEIEITGISEELLKEAAAKTEGFSGREITKLMASECVQAAVYGTEDCVLDTTLFRDVVGYKVAEHQQSRKLARLS